MLSPTVTELPRRLEPTARDTFLDAVLDPAPRHPLGSATRVLPSNVIALRPAIAGAGVAASVAA
jgi:hypothetical protein